MSLRYERTVEIELPVNDREKLRNFFIDMQNKDFFLGEYKNTNEEDYYVPYTEVKQSNKFVFTAENGKIMFESDLEYHSTKLSDQLTKNGFPHTKTEVIVEEVKEKENEIPSIASLYLTDEEVIPLYTVEGEDMRLDVSFYTYSWQDTVRIRYVITWDTDSKQSPKEIEMRMNDYFIAEMAHIQKVMVEGLLTYDIVINEPTLDCKFECISHTSQTCSNEIADATLNRLKESIE